MRYPNLTILVKAALSLSHGNADLERGFSQSGKFLTESRSSMSERMLNSINLIKDALKLYSNKAELVPIPTELVKMARSAHQSYKIYLDNKRQEEEKEKLKEIQVAKTRKTKKREP